MTGKKLSPAAPEQPNFWIVTDYKFFQHATLEEAEAERARLMERFPAKTFRVHRVKRRLNARTRDEAMAEGKG